MEPYPETVRHGGAQLTLDAERLLVAFRDEDVSRAEAADLLAQFELELEDEARETDAVGQPRDIVNHAGGRFWVRGDGPVPDDLVEELEAIDAVDWVAPVYHEEGVENSHVAPLPYVLLVRFREQSDREAFAEELGAEPDDERSAHLGPFVHYDLDTGNGEGGRSYRLRDRIEEVGGVAEVAFELMPMIAPYALIPGDTHFGDQWDMIRIDAPAGWDIDTGDGGVTVGVIDSGCDLGDPNDPSDQGHPDLNFDGPGFNAATTNNDGRPDTNNRPGAVPHGTNVAGIAAALLDNSEGVAGVSGDCEIHSVALRFSSNNELAVAINEATNQANVDVINMSLGWTPSATPVVDPAIANAHGSDVVLCAATGNGNANGVAYPARHDDVIAVGASDQNDERKRPASPDGECWWGSNWGTEIDVVAPGPLCWSTDIRDEDGYNDDVSQQTVNTYCGTKTYSTLGDPEGDYYANFSGTSSATPHVTGLAALLRSQYPTLSNDEVRAAIERTAEKVSQGTYTYSANTNKPNGSWNDEMGYGRINVHRALDFADTYVKDHPSDDGTVPFGGTFWNASDVIVRQNDDDVFSHQPIKAGQENYIYVRVENLGPAPARNVTVSARAVNFPGSEFVYPHDWKITDSTHIKPTSVKTNFANIPDGGTEIAKFKLSASQVSQMSGWHPCLLAEVDCDNDYGGAGGEHVWEDNDLAQRNVSIQSATTGSTVTYPFVAGHPENEEPYVELVVDRSRLPDEVELLMDPFDEEAHFPDLDLGRPGGETVRFVDRTRVELSLGDCDGVLTLQEGSTFDAGALCADHDDLTVEGGERVTRDGDELLALRDDEAVVGLPRQPGERRQLSLQFRVPEDADVGDDYRVDVAQRNAGSGIVGGVTLDVEVTD